jgi:hypothetical protein
VALSDWGVCLRTRLERCVYFNNCGCDFLAVGLFVTWKKSRVRCGGEFITYIMSEVVDCS